VIQRSRQALNGRTKGEDQSEPAPAPQLARTARIVALGASEVACRNYGRDSKQPKRAPKNSSYPYLRVANVLRGRLDLSEIHRFELFNGELDDCVHQNHIIRVRCVAVDPRFVGLFWNSPIGSQEIGALAVTSAGLYSLSTKKIGSVPVPVAPLEEQREIVRRVYQLLEAADRLQRQIETAARRVDLSSQAVLAKAFRGELTPTEAEQEAAEAKPRRGDGVTGP
jgi:hypothetical protein